MMKQRKNKNVEIFKPGKNLWEFKIAKSLLLKENIVISKMLYLKEDGFKI